ncbi:hypothetical protein ACQF36_42120 [Streptomyces sp. Marseille-Q5077]|uniref:hypothetical protein n=1 Tax=Streptomyces sp. Marseille-Q5077 TaxID=3418995 RepID=UPI003D0594C9
MAGESPDRSKQRESSAEPTSGSAVPVPEPDSPTRQEAGERRDPRLAVARETTAPRGGVDTATRVLSREDLDAVRTRLEEAGGTAEDSGGGDAADSTKGAHATADGAEGTDTVADAESRDAVADDAEAENATADDAEDADATADSTESTDAAGDDAENADADAGTDDAESRRRHGGQHPRRGRYG